MAEKTESEGFDVTHINPLVNRKLTESEQMMRLVSLLARANPDQKQLIRDALGVKDGIRKRRRRQTNSQARMFVAQFGECVHADGFEPAPSESIWAKGPVAVAAWRRKWEDGDSRALTGFELEELAAVATED